MGSKVFAKKSFFAICSLQTLTLGGGQLSVDEDKMSGRCGYDIQELCSVDTGLFADSVEWCPLPGYERFLACALYQLHEGNNDSEDVTNKSVSRLAQYTLYRRV